MVPRKCLSDNELRQLLQSPASSSDQRELEAHLESCDTCRDRLDRLVGSLHVPPDRESETRQFASQALTEAIAKLRGMAPRSASGVGQEKKGPVRQRFPFLSPPRSSTHLGQLGKYEILNVIGEGGMGVVFAATDPTLHRNVAIKVPAHSLVATQEAHDRFMREARAIASVKHDNIVTVHGVEEHDETLYLVMELIDGQSLAQRIEQERRLPWDEVARIGFETSAALVAAHARGLVHRDIKPGNILMEGGNGRVKVTDFGLAKSRVDTSLTDTGILAGTPEFMSPEQANDEEVTEQSDFFSLGAVLYAACSGQSPFRGQTAVSTLRRVCQDEVRPLRDLDPSIPAWFSDLIQRLMSKSPKERPAASELIQILSQHQSEMRPMPGHFFKASDSRQSVPAEARRRSPTLAAVAGLAIVGLLIAFVVWPKGKHTDNNVGQSTTGFAVDGQAERFSSLAAAVAAAKEGGVIEVYGDGPFLVPSLDSGTKSLAIRAAQGSTPVFLALSSSERSDQPFWSAKSDIHLQGIEVRWTIQSHTGINSEDRAERCIIDVNRGNLKLEACRLIAGRMTGCLSVADGSLELIRCHLISPKGPCCRWVPGDRSKLTATNSVFQGRVGIMFRSSGPTTAPRMSVDLANNSFATYRAFHVLMDRPLRPADFSSSGNAFDAQELLTLVPVRRPLSTPKLSAGHVRRVMMNNINWTESNNGYPASIAFLTRAIGANREVLVSSLNDWKLMWQQGVSGSTQVEFKNSEKTDSREPGHFAAIRVPSSGQPLGADLTIVGPGTVPGELH